MYAKNLPRRDEGFEFNTHPKDRQQDSGKGGVDLGVRRGQIMAPAATAGLVRSETVRDFLRKRVSKVRQTLATLQDSPRQYWR